MDKTLETKTNIFVDKSKNDEETLKLKNQGTQTIM